MNIAGIEYSINRRCLEIFLSGCKYPHCKGCHNEKLWDFNVGKDWTEWKKDIECRINSKLVDRIYIVGGEPLNQNRIELKKFICFLRLYNVELWLFTRYNKGYNKLDVDYVKTGEYIEGLPSKEYKEYNLVLASNNQKVIKL